MRRRKVDFFSEFFFGKVVIHRKQSSATHPVALVSAHPRARARDHASASRSDPRDLRGLRRRRAAGSAPRGGAGPGPASSELPLPDASLVELVDPPRRRRAEADRDDAVAPGPGRRSRDPLNCSSIEGVTGNMPGVELFYERASAKSSAPRRSSFSVFLFFFYAPSYSSLTATPRAAVAKFSGLEPMVVPGGVFHEVTGDISVFAPEDDALVREMEYFAAVFDVTVDEVRVDKPLLQEILRQFLAYGDVRRDEGSSVCSSRSTTRGTGPTRRRTTARVRSRSSPSGCSSRSPRWCSGDGAPARVGCSRGRPKAASSAITRAGARRSAGWTAGTPRRTAYREGGVTDDERRTMKRHRTRHNLPLLRATFETFEEEEEPFLKVILAEN